MQKNNSQYGRTLGYVMLCTKINTKRPNVLQKTALKSTLQLGSILEPNWLHFGKILGIKMEARWQQIAPKIATTNHHKNDPLLDRF